MRNEKSLKEYKNNLRGALENDFLGRTLQAFAEAYPKARAKAFKGRDVDKARQEIASIKDNALTQMMNLYESFKVQAEAAGAKVHLARTAQEANTLLSSIAKEAKVKTIVKSKSMTSEEIQLNSFLEEAGFKVVETDLGEWIIQLRNEGPSHMVLPAIHLSREQVADLFSAYTKKSQDTDIEKLVKVARRELRYAFATAEMGISGANVAIAESGTIGLVTNEGNARLVTTLPRIHVALIGLDKLLPTLDDALSIIDVLPKNATGQAITSYVTWITGANECGSSPDRKKEYHIVFLDNGRLDLAQDDQFSQVLRCVRCGACANVCPVYRHVGGHLYGHIYIGAIGFILTYFLHGKEQSKQLVKNCIGCEACKEVCASSIDLPELIKEIHTRIIEEDGKPLNNIVLSAIMSDRKTFHNLLKAAKYLQKPMKKKSGMLRHLPLLFSKHQSFRDIPALADTSFRDLWPSLQKELKEKQVQVGLFSGCVQDFVYPEQTQAGVEVMHTLGGEVKYPLEQTCCGLPLKMMGEKKALQNVVEQNLQAFDSENLDWIVTMCASCASFLKHAYPSLVDKNSPYFKQVQKLSQKIIDFSSLVHDVLQSDSSIFKDHKGKKTAYHSPCHLHRGLQVKDAPRNLITQSGVSYIPYEGENQCCGFGGTFSMNFPEISEQVLQDKLTLVQKVDPEVLVTDCPGCVLQLRGGARKQGLTFEVKHLAQILAEQLK